MGIVHWLFRTCLELLCPVLFFWTKMASFLDPYIPWEIANFTLNDESVYFSEVFDVTRWLQGRSPPSEFTINNSVMITASTFNGKVDIPMVEEEKKQLNIPCRNCTL